MKTADTDRSAAGKTLVFAILVLFFVIGMLSLPEYGVYVDEGGERVIVAQNVKEYVLRLLPEGSALRERYMTMDRALCENYGINTLRISESVERDHGVAIMLPMVFVMLSSIPPLMQSMIWHGYVFSVFFTSVIALYFIGKKAFGSRFWGLTAASLLYASPRFFAEGHYNNKDILLLALSMDLAALVIYSVDALEKDGRLGGGRLFFMALAAGFVMNTKIVGAALVALLGLMYIALMCVKKIEPKKITLSAVLTLTLALLFYYLLTPAMWGSPDETADFFRYLLINAKDFSRWDGNVLFRGELYRHSVNPLPHTYLLRMILLTTPIYISVFFLFGVCRLIAGMFREKSSFFRNENNIILLAALSVFLIPTVYASLVNVHIYNGWRHFYFVYAGVPILAAYGMTGLSHRFGRKTRKVYRAAIIVLIGISAAGIAWNHPFQYAYYNVLAEEPVENYELDYWHVGMKSAVKSVIADCDGAKRPVIAANDPNTRLALPLTVSMSGMTEAVDVCEYPKDADYIIENTTYIRVFGREDIDGEFEPFGKLSSYGNDIYILYRRK